MDCIGDQRPRFNRTPSIARRGSMNSLGRPNVSLKKLSEQIMGLVFFFHVGQPRTPIIDEALDATA